MNTRGTELLLARTFFWRFFENDLVPAGLPQVQLVIWGIALLAAPGYVVAFLFGIKYDRMARVAAASLPDAILLDQVLFVTFGMMALGLIALTIWEGVYPDRRDVRILGVLPLATRTHVLGRLGALAAVAALFCAGMNLPSAVVYGPSVWSHGAAAGPLRAVAAHLVVIGMAGVFTFFLLIAAQGLLLLVFGRRLAGAAALLLQTVLVVVVVQMFLFVPYLGSLVRDGFQTDQRTMIALLPPAWFVALYQVAAGNPRPVPAPFAFLAVLATMAAVSLATVIMIGSYRRLVRMAIETADSGLRMRAGLLARVPDAIARIVARDPVQRVVTGFTLRTIARSRAHRMLLAMYGGVGAALAVSAVLPLVVSRGMAALDAPHIAWLSVPLILNFFAVCGMRVLVGIPVEIKANWVFRLHGLDDRMPAAIGGVRLALLLGLVAPIATITGGIGVALWGARTGAVLGVFNAVLGLLLVDLLMVGLRKIPFACTYYPGRSRARTLWPLYVGAFSVYAYSLAKLEAAVLDRPVLLAMVVAAVSVVVAGLTLVRHRFLQPPPGLIYEEEDPDAAFGGFNLSEGLAAEAPARRRTRGA